MPTPVTITLSPELVSLQAKVRAFAQQEIKPLATSIWLQHELQNHPWLLCQKLFERGSELGFTKLLIPEEYGGLGLGCIDAVLLF